MTPEEKAQKHDEIITKISSEFKSRFQKEDGTFDVERAAKAFALKDEKVHYLNRENQTRRETAEEISAELEKREQAIAAKEEEIRKEKEAKLVEEKKYQDLVLMKDQEIEKLKSLEGELTQLRIEKQKREDQLKSQVEERLAGMGQVELDIYQTAATAIGDGAYEQKLALIEKLSKQPEQVKKPNEQNQNIQPSGGRSQTIPDQMTAAELYELKQTDPQLYQAELRKRISTE